MVVKGEREGRGLQINQFTKYGDEKTEIGKGKGDESWTKGGGVKLCNVARSYERCYRKKKKGGRAE
jgi:hypothetical protein